MKHTFISMWGWPVVLGILTGIGLVGALVGDGWWDYLSAVTLGLPVLMGAWYAVKRGKN